MNQKTRNRHVPLRRNASIFFIFLFCFGDDLLGREGERESERRRREKP